MNIFLFAAALSITLLSGIALACALRRAVEGYEDDSGFHAGSQHSEAGAAIATAPVLKPARRAPVRAASPQPSAGAAAAWQLGSRPGF